MIPILAGLALILAAVLCRPRRRQWTPPDEDERRYRP